MTGRRVVGIVGRALFACGVLVLLFVVYQLWGTGILEGRHQAALRTEFQNELRHAHTTTPAVPVTTSPTSSSTVPTTTPSRAQGPERPPALGQPVGVIQIPKINVDSVVVQGTADNDLSIGPGHYPATPLPGQIGNSAIAGHRTTYGAPFFSLNKLGAGDSIYVTTLQGRFRYRVFSVATVSPFDLSVVGPSSFAELTLTTCDPPFSAANRLVVQARLVGRAGLPASPLITQGTSRARGGTSGLAGGFSGGVGDWIGGLWWGLGCLALVLVEWRATRGISRRRRWIVYVASVPVLLVVLFFFFEGISSLLPTTF